MTETLRICELEAQLSKALAKLAEIERIEKQAQLSKSLAKLAGIERREAERQLQEKNNRWKRERRLRNKARIEKWAV
jgi:hypothetical protein